MRVTHLQIPSGTAVEARKTGDPMVRVTHLRIPIGTAGKAGLPQRGHMKNPVSHRQGPDLQVLVERV